MMKAMCIVDVVVVWQHQTSHQWDPTPQPSRTERQQPDAVRGCPSSNTLGKGRPTGYLGVLLDSFPGERRRGDEETGNGWHKTGEEEGQEVKLVKAFPSVSVVSVLLS